MLDSFCGVSPFVLGTCPLAVVLAFHESMMLVLLTFEDYIK